MKVQWCLNLNPWFLVWFEHKRFDFVVLGLFRSVKGGYAFVGVKIERIIVRGRYRTVGSAIIFDFSFDLQRCPTMDLTLMLKLNRKQWWLLVALNIFFLVAGQTAAVLLGRFYYDQGGNSTFMATIVQTAGFPILFIPLLLLPSSPASSPPPDALPCKYIAMIYVALGIVLAGDNLMYSFGLLYLSASTYSLVCTTQLAFNAVFAFFINSQKLTPLILNAVAILSFSAALLAVNDGSDAPEGVTTGHYAISFTCVRSLFAAPFADAAHLPKGLETRDILRGLGDANLHLCGRYHSRCCRGLHQRAMERVRGGNGEVWYREGIVCYDFGLDCCLLAGLLGGRRLGLDFPGLVSLLKRDEYRGSGSGAYCFCRYFP
ncbi:putative purine permease 11 [Drosera capensis]